MFATKRTCEVCLLLLVAMARVVETKVVKSTVLTFVLSAVMCCLTPVSFQCFLVCWSCWSIWSKPILRAAFAREVNENKFQGPIFYSVQELYPTTLSLSGCGLFPFQLWKLVDTTALIVFAPSSVLGPVGWNPWILLMKDRPSPLLRPELHKYLRLQEEKVRQDLKTWRVLSV